MPYTDDPWWLWEEYHEVPFKIGSGSTFSPYPDDEDDKPKRVGFVEPKEKLIKRFGF